jgi:hypothetical protein
MPFRWGSGPGCKAAGREVSFPAPSGTPVRLRIYVMTGYQRSRPPQVGGMVQAVSRYRFQKQRGNGPVQHPGRSQFIQAQPGNEGLGAPVSERGICFQQRPTQRPPTQACHLGGNSRFVDKDQPVRLKAHPWLTPLRPLVSRGTYLFAPSFRSDQGFFYMCS